MNTLNMIRDIGVAARYLGPEELVAAAREIGSIKIDQHGWGDATKPYDCEITFHNKNGSRIHAKGTDSDFFTAIAKAIEEARRLK